MNDPIEEPSKVPQTNVETWENDGGAVPDHVVFSCEKPSAWRRLPVRAHEIRHRMGAMLRENPTVTLAAAVGVGFLIGSRARAYPILRALLGIVATNSVLRLVSNIPLGDADAH